MFTTSSVKNVDLYSGVATLFKQFIMMTSCLQIRTKNKNWGRTSSGRSAVELQSNRSCNHRLTRPVDADLILRSVISTFLLGGRRAWRDVTSYPVGQTDRHLIDRSSADEWPHSLEPTASAWRRPAARVGNDVTSSPVTDCGVEKNRPQVSADKTLLNISLALAKTTCQSLIEIQTTPAYKNKRRTILLGIGISLCRLKIAIWHCAVYLSK